MSSRVPAPATRGRRPYAAVACSLAALAALALSAPAAAQTGRWVAGTVVEGGTLAPIAGAQVVVDGTERGALTDARGRFRIEGITGERATVRIVMIGYKTAIQEVATNDASVRFVLEPSAVALDQLVVTGTAGGTQKRAVGNAVGTVDVAKVQEIIPADDPSRMLNGRVPGVQVTPGTGMVGSGPRIRIRGTTTLSLSDQPLIYVDGVRVNNAISAGPTNQGYGSGSISRLGDINPDDIASIEVIKGPAAATLYGTEASNGVIQIITKRGRTDESAAWDVTVRQGANWFHDAENRVPTNWGVDPATGQVTEVNLIAAEAARGTPVFRTGHNQEYSASVRGGSQTIRYYLSGKYSDEQGIDINNNVSGFSIRSNVGFTPTAKWDIDASLGYVKSDIGLANDIGAGTLFNAMFSTNVDLNGPRRGFRSSPPEVFRQRALAVQDLARFTGSIKVQHRPAEWFTHRLTVGQDDTQEKNSTTNPFLGPDAAVFFNPTTALGSKSVEYRNVLYNTVDYSATLDFDLTESLSSATSAGGQYYRRQTEWLAGVGREFTAPGLSTVTGTARTTSSEDLIENVTVGTFLQEQLSWKNRLFVTGAIRVDNNSAFGSEFDFVTYPKLSASWVVSEEDFWSVPYVGTLRLRGAFGRSGQQPESFAAIRSFKPITLGTGQGGVSPEFVGNPDLSPERGQELEFGFEAGMLDERVGLEVTYYNQNTKDAILLRQLAPSGGFPGSQYINIGELENQGVELQLNASVVQRDAVSWEVGFNFSHNTNKVLDVSGAASGVAENGANYIRMGSNLDTPGVHLRHQEGLPAGSWFGRRVVSAQLDADGTAFNVLCDGGDVSASPLPCAQAPEVFLGRSDPNVEGSITSSVTLLRNLTLSGLVDFKLGVKHGENDTLVRCALFGSCEANHFPERADPVFVAQIQSAAWHDFAVADASFWKIRDVSLSYLLPERFAGQIGARQARLTVTGRNLKTWTDWTSMDPETFFLSHQFDKWSQTFTPHPMAFLVTANVSF